MKKRFVCLCLLLALCLIPGATMVGLAEVEAEAPGMFDFAPIKHYTVYIGTIDKDTGAYEHTLDEAEAIVSEICREYTDGYTVLQLNGGWQDAEGNWTEEDTLMYIFMEIDETDLAEIVALARIALNQNSILIEVEDRGFARFTG